MDIVQVKAAATRIKELRGTEVPRSDKEDDEIGGIPCQKDTPEPTTPDDPTSEEWIEEQIGGIPPMDDIQNITKTQEGDPHTKDMPDTQIWDASRNITGSGSGPTLSRNVNHD